MDNILEPFEDIDLDAIGDRLYKNAGLFKRLGNFGEQSISVQEIEFEDCEEMNRLYSDSFEIPFQITCNNIQPG